MHPDVTVTDHTVILYEGIHTGQCHNTVNAVPYVFWSFFPPKNVNLLSRCFFFKFNFLLCSTEGDIRTSNSEDKYRNIFTNRDHTDALSGGIQQL